MVMRNIFLTRGMSKESVLENMNKVRDDKSLHSIHIVGHDFGDEDDDEATLLLIDVLTMASRQWSTVKFVQCRGMNLCSLIQSVMTSNCRRFCFSPSPETVKLCMSALSMGLKSNRTLLTLGLHDIAFDHPTMSLVADGLEQNQTLMELSLAKSRFSENDTCHLSLAQSLRRMSSLQHVSFSDCYLTDSQCHQLISLGLMGIKKSLLELTLEGNQCYSRGLSALSEFLHESSLLCLDLASQRTDSPMDLAKLAPGLTRSRIRCLQLSENTFTQQNPKSGISKKDDNDCSSFQALSRVIAGNTSLQILHLAWCPLHEEDIVSLSNGLRGNTTLHKLVLYECGIDNRGLSRLAIRLSQMKGLKRLDLGGQQAFDSSGLHTLERGLQRNTELEEVLLPPPSNQEAHQKSIFWCDTNRGGRRFLRSKEMAPSGLWPLLLGRIETLSMPSMRDGSSVESSGDCEAGTRGTSIISSSQTTTITAMDVAAVRRASILYYLLRNGPLLEQQATTLSL